MRCSWGNSSFWEAQKTVYLLKKNKEGDIGSQCSCQRALAGDQVETSGCLDGTLLPSGCVLHADSSCTVIRHHFSVAGVGEHKKLVWLTAGEQKLCHPDANKTKQLLQEQKNNSSALDFNYPE